MMKRVVWDIETNGLLHQLDRVHSLCIKDLDTGELLSCTDDPDGRALGYAPIADGLEVLSNADKIYGHNIIGFDIPALRKVYPEWTYRGQEMDTLVIAGFVFAHLRQIDAKLIKSKKNPKGTLPGHLYKSQSLEAWGRRLGEHKVGYKEWCRENGIKDVWSEWRPEMQTYCEQDLVVNEALIHHLRKQGVPRQALEIETHLRWYLTQQERNGWPFNLEKAQELHAELAERKAELSHKLIDEFGWWYQKAGRTVPKRTVQYRVSKTRSVPELIVEGAPYTRIKKVEFNPNSRQHIAKVLKENYGWRPTEYTSSGQPKLSEDVLLSLNLGVSESLLEYLMVDNRLAKLATGKQAWIKCATTESPAAKELGGIPMIHHRILQNSCVTHRGSHKSPNAGQVPKVLSDKGGPIKGLEGKYGWECRDLWMAPPGDEWVMVGADASGLELRCLAHYMARWDGGAYGRAILEGDKSKGTDIHSLNRDALRQTFLPPKLAKFAPNLGELSRDDAKTFIYAYLYGAGDGKLGSIVAPGAPQKAQALIGKRLRSTFESKIPALGELQKAIKSKVKRGWLRMPDGRKTYIRHKHAALNSLLQAAGAIICKVWMVEFDRALNKEYGTRPGGGWDQVWAALGWIHDEDQIAARKEHAKRVAEIMVESIRRVTDIFDWRIPLDGEADIGPSWAHTH